VCEKIVKNVCLNEPYTSSKSLKLLLVTFAEFVLRLKRFCEMVSDETINEQVQMSSEDEL